MSRPSHGNEDRRQLTQSARRRTRWASTASPEWSRLFTCVSSLIRTNDSTVSERTGEAGSVGRDRHEPRSEVLLRGIRYGGVRELLAWAREQRLGDGLE